MRQFRGRPEFAPRFVPDHVVVPAAVLFSSHVLQEVEAVCDRVVILRKGVLVHEQAMADLRDGRHVSAILSGELSSPPPGDAHRAGLEKIINNQNETTLKLAVCIDRNTAALQECSFELRRFQEQRVI